MSTARQIKKRELVAQAFGLHALEIGWIQSVSEVLGRVTVEHVWFAEISGYWKQRVTVGRVFFSYYGEQRQIARGLVLAPKGNPLLLNFCGEEPLRSIDLGSSPDPLQLALQCLNLAEEGIEIPPGNINPVSIDLEIWHENGYRRIQGEGYMGKMDASWRQLKKALVGTTYEFAARYQDDELTEFLNTQLQPQFPEE